VILSGRVDVGRLTAVGDVSLFDRLNSEIEVNENHDADNAVSCLLIYAQEKPEEHHQQE